MIRGFAPRHALMGRLVGAGYSPLQTADMVGVMQGLPPGVGNPGWPQLPIGGGWPNGLNYQNGPSVPQPRMLPFSITSAGLSNGTTIVADQIVAGATATLTGTPQAAFKVQRPVISSAVAPFFIVGITIGARPQTVNGAGNGVPAVLYSEVAQNTMVDFDTLQPGITMSVTVTNIDASPHRFDMGFIGAAAIP